MALIKVGLDNFTATSNIGWRKSMLKARRGQTRRRNQSMKTVTVELIRVN